MDEIMVVYWSQTGNTEAMAQAVAQGIEEAGKKAKLAEVSAVSAADLKDVKAFALGCPAMGAEVLEEDEMEPFVAEVEGFAAGKTVGLFGSYGWGGQSIGQVENALKDCKVEICLDMQKILNTPNPKLLKDLQNAVMGLKEA